MNKIIKYIGISILGVTTTGSLISCDSFLDTLPDNRTELHSASDVSSLLVSAYPSRHPAYLLEMESDNTDDNVNTGWDYATRFQKQAYEWSDITETQDDESPQNLWEAFYKAMSTANVALQFMGNDSTAYGSQMGEALMCRAYSAFMLSTIFCNAYDETTASGELGIPYPTEPETEVGVKYERGTLKEVYEKIDADLQKGLSLVSDDYTIPKFHFNRTAAYAFATRFYLYYHKYDKAVAYATKALGSVPANKLRDWKTWDALSKNDQIQPEAYANSNVTSNFLLLAVYSEWGAVCGPYSYGQEYAHDMNIAQYETIASTGPWGSYQNLYYGYFQNSSMANVFVRKMMYKFEYTDLQAGIGYAHNQIVAFNAEETLLCRAEAEALQHDYDAAVADINAVLSKFSNGRTLSLAGITSFYSGIDYCAPDTPTVKKKFNTSFAIESQTEEPLLQCILHLRRILTIHEGLRWQDIKRYGIVVYRRRMNSNGKLVAVTDTMSAGDPRHAIQLPQDVINAGMTPNPRNK
jgi:starch-binding outer membrane protein, SusD/RagB family